jgi:flagellar motor protein MotB
MHARAFVTGVIVWALVLACHESARAQTTAPPESRKVQLATKEKLDQILDKLDKLEERLNRMEGRILRIESREPDEKKTASPPYDFEQILAFINECLGYRLFAVGSSDPNQRMIELLNESEDLKQIEYEWERIWFVDHPGARKIDEDAPETEQSPHPAVPTRIPAR